jgi:hypothetical protein
MKIKIKKMLLENFKGFEKKEIIFSDKVKLIGENETGKTRVADAFTWVLFGKDTADRKDYEIKTLDENNNVIHGLEHSAEIVLLVDEQEINLKRIYKENWVKKKGLADRVFSGHTTSFFYNSVEIKKKEYDEKVTEILDETMFKLLACNNYFNKFMDWKQRREIIMDMFVSELPSEAEIVDQHEKLWIIRRHLSNADMETIEKELKAKRALLNKQLKEIPIRIDELKKSTEGKISSKEIKQAEEELESLREETKALDNDLANLNNLTNSYNSSYKEITNKKLQIDSIQKIIKKNHESEVEKIENSLKKTQRDIQQIEYIIEDSKRDQEKANVKIVELENYRKELIVKYDSMKATKFDENKTFCPTCFQKLQADKIKIVQEEFTENIKSELAKIQTIGKKNNENIKECSLIIQNRSKTILENKTRLNELCSKFENETKELQLLKSKKLELETEEIGKIREQISELEANLESPDKLQEARKNEILDKKKKNIERTKDAMQILTNNSDAVKSKKRIEELNIEAGILSQRLAGVEQEVIACEEFIKTKVNLIEDKVAEKFQGLRFKLFNTLINNGIEECCEVLKDGVPFGALSNGAKIKCGLKIIDVLQKHYNLFVPVFIDNAEGVTGLEDIDTQTISMFVKENVKKLEIK